MHNQKHVTNLPFAKIWMHVGMVTISGEKMSKSLGNTKSIKQVLENWGPNIIRLFCLSGHYSKVNRLFRRYVERKSYKMEASRNMLF